MEKQNINNDDLNAFFKKLFLDKDVTPKYDNLILNNHCSNLFSISSKYLAIYLESLGEIIITEISRQESKIRFSCKGLRCFTYTDDDHIFGFFNSNLFFYEISTEEYQIKECDYLSISKVSLLPSNNSEDINSLLILDEFSSKLMIIELMDGNRYTFLDLFTNVIDFSTTSSHIFVLYEKEAKLYEINNYEPNEVLSISINVPFPSHVQCTSASYIIFFPNGYCVYDESGFKIHKKLKEGDYIYSMNCASVQTPKKAIVFCDEGKQEIESNSIKSMAIMNERIYYTQDGYNILSTPLKVTTDSQHVYYTVSKFKSKIEKNEIQKFCRESFPNNSLSTTLLNMNNENICLFDFDKQIELPDFENKIKTLFKEESNEILIEKLEPFNITDRYLYFFCDDEFTTNEKLISLINSINHSSATVKFQDRICMIDTQNTIKGVRTATFLHCIYPKLELYSKIENMLILSLVYPEKANVAKKNLVKKSFQFDNMYPGSQSNIQILKFNNEENYQNALQTKIYKYDGKEAELTPLVDFNTFSNMKNWKLRLNKLNKTFTKEEIFKHFSGCGQIYNIDMSSDIFIQFVCIEDANKALEENGKKILGSTISISFLKQKKEILFDKKQRNKNDHSQNKKRRDRKRKHENIRHQDHFNQQKQQNQSNQQKQQNQSNQQKQQNQSNQQKQQNQSNQQKQQNQSNQKPPNNQLKQRNQQDAPNQKNNHNQKNQKVQQNNKFTYTPSQQKTQQSNQPNRNKNRNQPVQSPPSSQGQNQDQYKQGKMNDRRNQKKKFDSDNQNTQESQEEKEKVVKDQKAEQDDDQDQEQEFFDDDDDDDDEEIISPNQGVVTLENSGLIQLNPFQDSSSQSIVLPTSNSPVPRIELRNKNAKITFEKPKKDSEPIVFIFNHKIVPEQNIRDEFKLVKNIEIIEPPNSVLDDRPIIKLTFSDKNSKDDFIKKNQNIASGNIRICITDCTTLDEAIQLRSQSRKKFENLMIRISSIPPQTSKSEIIRCITNKINFIFEYAELIINNDDGSLICDIAMKNKTDFQKFLKISPRIQISNINIAAEGYQDLMARQKS